VKGVNLLQRNLGEGQVYVHARCWARPGIASDGRKIQTNFNAATQRRECAKNYEKATKDR